MVFLNELIKKIAFRFTRFGTPTYQYGIEPIQIAEIIKGIDTAIANNTSGTIVEIGVARGMTSRLIVEHILASKYDVEFYCLDTFSSFTEDDIAFEIGQRGKKKKDLIGFAYNDYDIWKDNFSRFPFVKAVKCDASEFDFSKIEPIALCFLDVDLYIPTKNVLEHIYPYMGSNSTILVDDVMPHNQWDGAYQAFMEFTQEKRLEYEIAGNKCGIIRLER